MITNSWCKIKYGFITGMAELAWRSGSIMDCHATARGSIPGGYRASRPSQGAANGVPSLNDLAVDGT